MKSEPVPARSHEEWIAEARAAIETQPATAVEDHHKQVIAYLLGYHEAAQKLVENRRAVNAAQSGGHLTEAEKAMGLDGK